MTEKKPNDIEKTNQEDSAKVHHFVTPLLPIARQVGEHVLSALEHDKTVAVLTTITGSNSGNQVVSIPLEAEHVQQVQHLIAEIHRSNEPERVPCVGFHCLLDDETASAEEE